MTLYEKQEAFGRKNDMKQWLRPQVQIDQYVANEYISSCSWQGDSLVITCGLGHEPGSDFTSPSHSYGETCYDTLTIAGATEIHSLLAEHGLARTVNMYMFMVIVWLCLRF